MAILAGLAVLIGAIAAARASRLYDNVILRVLGASRGQLLGLQVAEYGLLALILAAVALALGSWRGVAGGGPAVRVRLAAQLAAHPRRARPWRGDRAGLRPGRLAPVLRARPAQALREL